MYPIKIQKYKCFGCGGFFSSKEISAVCPVCKCKGVKIKEDPKFSEVEWRKAISRAERFIEKIK